MRLSNTSFYLLAIMAVTLVAATSYEHLHGTPSALQVFYHTPWFIGLWGLIALTAIIKVARSKHCRRPAVMAIHIALLIILSGALATHLTGREGTLTLRKGQPATSLYLTPDNHVGHLPFALSADSLQITLNHPLYREGHILYLMSSAPDDRGFTLKVVKDTLGFTLSHIGYLLLFLSFITFLSSSAKEDHNFLVMRAPRGVNDKNATRSVDFHKQKHTQWQKAAGGVLFLITALLYIYRGLIAGRVPLANGGEVWHFCALCAFALTAKLRPLPCIAVGTLALGVSFFSTVSLTAPVPPVLQSFWLILHVIIIIMAYALLAYLAVVPSQNVLRWAVGTLAVGIFLGAAWAGQAWGRCWGWDPKEVWALITLLIYVMPLHRESLPWFRSTRHMRWYLRLAFLAVLFTYFGVNYVLGGLHSYAA